MTRPGLSTSIETRSGRFFDYADPDPLDVFVADIARGLANTARFAGQTSRFFSVAEHALLVRRLVIEAGNPELAFAALHHDSHEAYLGDVPSPLKALIGGAYANMRMKADLAIAARFGIDALYFDHPRIKQADLCALRIEARVLKASRGVGPHWGTTEAGPPAPWPLGLSPEAAEDAFLQTHEVERSFRG